MNVYTVRKINDSDLITAITLEIMNALLKWFSPPEDIIKKSIAHKEMPFFTAYEGDRAVGFIALKAHNQFAIELYNVGVLEEYHHRGIGSALMQAVEQYCIESEYKFITVKTLDSSAQYEPYERTRSFYIKNGFIPLEVFKTYWDEENPCLFLAKYIGT